jgi:hypothetical protein
MLGFGIDSSMMIHVMMDGIHPLWMNDGHSSWMNITHGWKI